ncbi:DMT family transporter [Streptomyces sp. TRM49041]|uniref:DMT family transporter n=1 Tax=Streptomyces sp. TRM49041 TaxID=2603216 RepID=UPI0011EF9C45|nr:DMT family transporter [Streptomyces sp. TRM49041]
MQLARDRLALGAFAVTCLLAGGNAVGIRFSNRELDPLWGAALRFGAAALLLLAIMAARRLAWPRGRALAGSVLFGLLNFGVTFALAYYALLHIHAGLGQTLLSLVPLAALLLAVAQHQERFRRVALAGTLCAVAGVAVMSRAPLQAEVPVTALLAALGSVLSFAQAAVLVRRLPKVHPVTMNAVGMTAAAVALFAGSLAVGDEWVRPERAATWWALAYLVVAGSVLTFICYLVVIQRWGASRAAYVFVVIPVVTIAASAWLDDEPLTVSLLLGAPLILVGVYLGALRPAAEEPAAEESPAEESPAEEPDGDGPDGDGPDGDGPEG